MSSAKVLAPSHTGNMPEMIAFYGATASTSPPEQMIEGNNSNVH